MDLDKFCCGRGPGVTPHGGQASVDWREALYNDRPIGPVGHIQVPAERITRLHGIVLDLDPRLYLPGNVLFPPDDDPCAFYENIRPVLERHPLARHAEVRKTGTGLHLIVCLEPAVELTTAADQERWGAAVRTVQCTLPTDPDALGITTLTRPLGSINSKNGAAVELLRAGTPVTPEEVEQFLGRLEEAPFREVALPLLGATRMSPCPVCDRAGTRLDVLDFVGKCYGGCSKVTVADLYDRVFISGEAGGNGNDDPAPVRCRGRKVRELVGAES
jgi:hypothetical protein